MVESAINSMNVEVTREIAQDCEDGVPDIQTASLNDDD